MKRNYHGSNVPPDPPHNDSGFSLSTQAMVRPHPEPLTPPQSPTKDRPAKRFRHHGSKLMSVLRSLTNSSSGMSVTTEQPTPEAEPKPHVTKKKLSLALLGAKLEPTVVHRSQFKSRPSIISIDKGVLEITPENSPSSPSNSGGSSNNSGKSSGPSPGVSTGMTSLDSKFSVKSIVMSQHSSSDKKMMLQGGHMAGSGSLENPLAPIIEWEAMKPEPVPTVITVEKAAAAKIFFECHYNALASASPRSMRRRKLEVRLDDDPDMSPSDMAKTWTMWMQRESEHLRETRLMKVRATTSMIEQTRTAADYDVVKVLGKGSFGVVRLVREKDDRDPEQSKRIYAMKVIRKSDMLRNSQEGHLRAERDFLVASEGSRWVVPLIASFQDLNNLYLVMDYMPGGDFLGLLIRDNVLNEPVAKFYIAEMILCIEEAHRLKWIHRDIKPDNFLISASGHLKISDFGLAFDGHWSHDQAYFNNHRYSLLTKLGINVEGDTLDKKEGRNVAAAMKMAHTMMGAKERHEMASSNSDDAEGILNWRNRNGNRSLARSVVGTSQYMAPEVVRGEPYDARCDWWSVAVILYECIYGHTPFLAEEGGRQQTKVNIVNHKTTFRFPSKPVISRRCQDLIRNMIQEKDHRLCSKRYRSKDMGAIPSRLQDHAGRYVLPNDAEDIKSHKWFRDIQWDTIHQTTPPFIPNIKSMDDTHYFDEEEPISDFSGSASVPDPKPEDIQDALRPFNREIQILATSYIDRPFDSTRMRKVEKEIDAFNMGDEQKDYLKAFVKHYGRKEPKRPRDRLLRDKEVAPKVLELRKRGAFLGYTYRRIKMGKESLGRGGAAGFVMAAGPSGKRNVWHRGRLSYH